MHHKTLKGFVRGPYQKERRYSTMLNGTHLALEILPARKPSLHNKLFCLRDSYFFISSLTEPLWKTWIGHKMLAHKENPRESNRLLLVTQRDVRSWTLRRGFLRTRHKGTTSVMRHTLRIDTQRAAMIINCCNQYAFPAFSPRMPHSTRFQSKVLMHLHNDSSIWLWGRGHCWSADS